MRAEQGLLLEEQKMSTFRTIASVAACAAALAIAAPAMAETVNFKADLKATEENPPVNSKGNGALTASFDTGSRKLSWKGNYTGLSGPATAAHFHAGEKGKNGGVVVPISPATSPMEGSATLTPEQATDLMAGKWYVNVH